MLFRLKRTGRRMLGPKGERDYIYLFFRKEMNSYAMDCRTMICKGQKANAKRPITNDSGLAWR